METESALWSFAALSQSTRLETFRLLVRHEPEGLAAGEIADRLAVPANTLSAHLGVLSRAGLVTATRHSRSIIYRADLSRLSDLVLFLVKDCCQGRSELCQPLVAELAPCCARGPMDVVIYHNPACGTSRNTLALIRHVGIEPHVVEYLKTPPSRALLASLVQRMGGSVRDLLREKGTPYAELALGDPSLTHDQLLDAVEAHPILMNRPLVISPLGVKLCRPSEVVLDLLPAEGLKPFTKEDGEVVVDGDGRRIRG